MLYNLRKSIEEKRESPKLFWKIMIVTKDLVWKCITIRPRDLKPIILHRIDSGDIQPAPDEIFAFLVVRNEAMRLPYLISYYQNKGVDRFFVVDNGSQDETVTFLLSQKNVHVFETKASFQESGCGSKWVRKLMKRYAYGHWSLVIDADEIVVFPHCEKLSFKNLCSFLDREGSTAMCSFLLDMYSDKPTQSTQYKKGDDLMRAFPYFDGTQDYIQSSMTNRDTVRWYRGGVRKRLFGVDALLNKVFIVKCNRNVSITIGQHDAKGVIFSDMRGVTLHFKYTGNFKGYILKEAEREEHWDDAVEYKQMAEKLKKVDDITLFGSTSTRFIDSTQLIDLNIMKTSKKFEEYTENVR